MKIIKKGYKKPCEPSFKRSKNVKKQQYGRERYKNLLEHEKQKLAEYRKKYYKLGRNALS